jgi:Zn-dependent protease
MDRIDLVGFLGVGIGLAVGMFGHEVAHARAALALGDPTPRLMGRARLDPRVHVDPFGTLVLPAVFLVSMLFKVDFGFFFGYAKPVPYTPSRLHNPRRDAILVALAGPAFNLAVAVAAGLGFRAAAGAGQWRELLVWITVVNAFLFVVNLLPIPPLDGSRILARFLSPQAAMRLEEWGQYLVLFLVALFLLFRPVLGNMGRAVYGPILGPPF